MDSNKLTIKEDFEKNIFRLFQIEKLKEEDQIREINKITKIIFDLVLIKTLPLLSKEELEKYEELSQKEDTMPEDLFEFLGEHVPDFIKIVIEETEKFRKESESIFNSIK